MAKKGRIYIPNQNMPRICPDLAKEIGLNESILLLQLDYWLSVSGKKRDDRLWVYESLSDIQNALSFWSRPTINRMIHSLEDQSLITVGNFNRRKSDKTRWITLNYEIVATLESIHVEGLELFQNETTPYQAETTPCQNDTTLFQNETALPHDPNHPNLSTHEREDPPMTEPTEADRLAAELFPEKPPEPTKTTDPGILSTAAARDPLSMSAECARRQEQAGLGQWTIPVEAGGSDTAGDLMLAAWTDALEIDPAVLPAKTKHRYRAKFAIMASGFNTATPAQCSRAVAAVLDPRNTEFNWYTYTDPAVAKFGRDWQAVMLRILSGHDPMPIAAQVTGLAALDAIT